MQALVLKAYLCAGSPQPDPDLLAFEAGAWEEVLTAADVPDEDLNEVYRRAMSHHTSTFRLSTGELITAWQAIRAERAAVPVALPAEPTLTEAWAAAEHRILDLQERLRGIG